MSLLTQEQINQLAEAHQAFQRPIEEGTERLYDVALELSAAVGDLTAIIDYLQARAPKQYTEKEHYAEFEKVYPPLEGVAHKQIFKGWLMCARFLGALKAEP